jgi:hypothetical protein
MIFNIQLEFLISIHNRCPPKIVQSKTCNPLFDPLFYAQFSSRKKILPIPEQSSRMRINIVAISLPYDSLYSIITIW